MSDRQYAEQRIKQALEKTHGNVTRAKQQIIAWCYEDEKLLQALTRPHLTGIVAYNIERILSGRGTAEAPPLKPSAPQGKKDNFGIELLQAAVGGSTFGLEAYSSPTAGKRKVSQSHIDAIRAMARKST